MCSGFKKASESTQGPFYGTHRPNPPIALRAFPHAALNVIRGSREKDALLLV